MSIIIEFKETQLSQVWQTSTTAREFKLRGKVEWDNKITALSESVDSERQWANILSMNPYRTNEKDYFTCPKCDKSEITEIIKPQTLDLDRNVKCGYCGAMNPHDALKCSGCGAAVEKK